MPTRACAFVVVLCIAVGFGAMPAAEAHTRRKVRSRYVEAHRAEERADCGRHSHDCSGEARWRHLVTLARRAYVQRRTWLRDNRPTRFFSHHGTVRQAIEMAFPDHVEDKAKAVAHCESELDVYAVSSSGRYHGLFQMGPEERERFGFRWNGWTQARGAYRYWKISGWQPWPVCGD